MVVAADAFIGSGALSEKTGRSGDGNGRSGGGTWHTPRDASYTAPAVRHIHGAWPTDGAGPGSVFQLAANFVMGAVHELEPVSRDRFSPMGKMKKHARHYMYYTNI